MKPVVSTHQALRRAIVLLHTEGLISAREAEVKLALLAERFPKEGE